MVKILDATLREGEQTPHVNFTVDEKVHIAKLLDKIGVDMIEAGDPSVSPKVFEAVKKIAGLGLKAEIVAHSLVVKEGIDNAKKTGVDRVVVLFPTSDIHLKTKMNISREKALKIIKEQVSYAKGLGMKVRFTPEDASRTDFDFLVKACNTAIEAGADRVSYADTIGVMQPHDFYNNIKKLKENLQECEIDLHCHNDFGLALANAMAGIRAGADCIHTTVNGMGERTGIPDLAETIMAFRGLNKLNRFNPKYLIEISSYVEKVSGFFIAPNKTITGQNAFSHKCGVHTNAVLKNPKTYEAIDPETVGRHRSIIIDKYTGRSALKSKLNDYGIKLNENQLKKVVQEIKKVGDQTKIMNDIEIIEITERVTGKSTDVIPKNMSALVLVRVGSNIYTSAIVRRLKNFKNIKSLYELTGEFDISAYVEAENTSDLNSIVEQIRETPGVTHTKTKLVLKKYSNLNEKE